MSLSPKKSRRRLISLAVVVCVLLLFAIFQQAFNLSPFFGDPESQTTLFLWAFASLNVILLLTCSLILLRQLLKLYFEQKDQRLGSRFQSKLLLSFLGLAFVPGVFMSFFAYVVVHRNLDKWFSLPMDQLQEPVGKIVTQVEHDAAQGTILRASLLAKHPVVQKLWTSTSPEAVQNLTELFQDLNVHFLVLFDQSGSAILAYRDSKPYLPTTSGFRDILQPLDSVPKDPRGNQIPEAIRGRALRISWGDGSADVLEKKHSLMMSGVWSREGSLIIGVPPPDEVMNLARELSILSKDYGQMKDRRKMIRTNFMLVLGVVTLLILFAAFWIGLFLSRKITVPIRALAEASNEVFQGNLSVQVYCPAEDELGILVSSFNRMTAQLHENSQELEKKNLDLRDSNRALETRRRYTEAVLENIPTGVISIAPDLSISTMNKAAQEMLGLKRVANLTVGELFQSEDFVEIQALIQKASRVGIASKELELKAQGHAFYCSVTFSPLESEEGSSQGFVMVLEDLTELLRAQKANAWREVARRMAHEIKNPLTPIQLSAERVLKNLSKSKDQAVESGLASQEASYFELTVKECVQTITREVRALKGMVDEFSRFARLPSPTMVPSNLNAIIEKTLSSYDGRFDGIKIVKELATDLPRMKLDPEQLRRVLVNLIDNALEAMDHSKFKQLSVSSQFSSAREMVQLVVRDTGQGISVGDRDKLFLPYFSTRKRGTGLGLAIASQIVADHKGYIHVEESFPRGASFVIELPAA